MKTTYMQFISEDYSLNMHHQVSIGDDCGIIKHNHKYYEIFMLMSEEASFVVEGSRYNMKSGDIIIFNSRELHKIEFDINKPYERFVIHFVKELVLPFCTDSFNILKAFENRGLGMYNYIPKNVAQRENIADYFNKIKICNLGDDIGKDVMMKCLFIQMLVAINRVIDENVRVSVKLENDNKIPEILKYINENLNSSLTLDALSEKFFISKYYMSHIFKSVTGFSVNQYIAYKRILLADEMISEGKTAAEACEAAGFNDYSNFYKTFCKILGRSPKYSQGKG